MRTIRNIKARARFENNQSYIGAYQGDVVTIWIDGLINSEFFEIDLDTDLTINQISNNQIEITSDIIGWNRINVLLSNIPKSGGTKKTRIIDSLILMGYLNITNASSDTILASSDEVLASGLTI